jgi:hypothetical protein
MITLLWVNAQLACQIACLNSEWYSFWNVEGLGSFERHNVHGNIHPMALAANQDAP